MTSFTSDNNSRKMIKYAFFHLFFAIFCALFGAIYEKFSFGVYSYFMIYAFAIPLLLGTLPLLIIALWKNINLPVFSLRAWNSGIAVLTTGCIVQGVLNIYGTTNRLMIFYSIAGAVLLSVGVISYIHCNKQTVS